MDYSSFIISSFEPKYTATLLDPTANLASDSPSISQIHPPPYRHTLAAPSYPSTHPSEADKDSKSSTKNATTFQELEPTPGSSILGSEKGHRWTRLKRRMGRQRISHSVSSVPSCKSLPPISETNSEQFSIPAAHTSSTTTKEVPCSSWDNFEYTNRLDEAVKHIQNDFMSGSKEMADSALATLSTLIVAGSSTAGDREELWNMVVWAAKKLCAARPSMNAAMTSCLLRALNEIKQLWEILDEKRNKEADDLAAMARRQLVRILEKRNEGGIRLGENFAERLKAYCRQRLDNAHTLTILTLGNSSAIRAGILTILSHLRFLHLNLIILESRPRFEGASMASQILSSTCTENRARLHVRILPDCAVGSVAKDTNILLLGADRISCSGDVSNKIGSLAAAICVKKLNSKAQVVVMSDADKIVADGMEETAKEIHSHSELSDAWDDDARRGLAGRIGDGSVDVFGEWLEWVPAECIDGYVTENGVLDKAGVARVAHKMKELKELKEKMFV